MISPFLVYMFLKRLTTPFVNWEAYKTGVIDEKGNILIKARDRNSIAQRDSFTMFDRLCLNIKKLLNVLPGGSTRIASYAAALFLLRESKVFEDSKLLNESIEEIDMDALRSFIESVVNEDGEGPTNTANPEVIGGFTPERGFLRKKKGDRDNVIQS